MSMPSAGVRLLRAACVSALLMMAGCIAHAGEPGASSPGVNHAAATATKKDGNASSVTATAAKSAVKLHPAAAGGTTKPLWADLSPAQQRALMPLASEWDKMDAPRKKKWLALSSKFASLKPEEQARLHDRMRDWAKLTPEQRRLARESYARANKLKPGEKAAQWQQYQQLPEEQKKKLASEAAAKNRVASLPPASQSKGRLTPPPKSTLKREARALPATGQIPPAHPSPQVSPRSGPQPAVQPATQSNSQ